MTISDTIGRTGRRALIWSTVALATGLTASACQSVTPQASAEGSPNASSSPSSSSAAPATLTVTPADGASSVRPDAKIRVRASNGTLADVQVASSGKDEVAGEFNSDKTVWTATAGLLPKTKYTVTTTA